MKELDGLLMPYLQDYYPRASEAERAAFATLLELQDPQVLEWCLGQGRPNDMAMTKVVDTLMRLGAARH
jgi:antitoxin CptB